MGQVMSSCVERKGNASEVPQSAARPTSGEEISDLEGRITLLEAHLAEMLDTSQELHRSRADLARTNGRLRRALEENNSQKVWDRITVVERHYKQLERHRMRMLFQARDGCNEGESGTGASTVSSCESTPRLGDLSTPRDAVVSIPSKTPRVELTPRPRETPRREVQQHLSPGSVLPLQLCGRTENKSES
mmetsp:Transcript_90494/g.194141  ORF Transcript_90494/g.194141 Transcript_90494/m.194141 type:complete len:190 (-) Transcript_90494:31-600(-)